MDHARRRGNSLGLYNQPRGERSNYQNQQVVFMSDGGEDVRRVQQYLRKRPVNTV